MGPLLLKKFLLLLPLTLLPLSANAFCFQEAGQRYAVSPWLLWAIAKAESNLDPSAIHHNRNGTIDVGLMQINSIWAGQLGGTWDVLGDPCTNVMTGAWILSQCIQDYGYTWAAVGCYHSRTPTRRDAYAARIAAILERAGAGQ
jgi:soluble lytic murein transglycosylase-like protein